MNVTLDVISMSIAAAGVMMLLLLYSRIRQANHDIELRKHRSKEAGFADLLNYAAVVDDGVIVGKNGSFVAAWLYRGEDNASATKEQREMVSLRINQALSGLGAGWMVHVDAVRRPAPTYANRNLSHFSDRVSKAIDEERRRMFEGLGTMYEGYFVLTITYFPPMLVQRKFIELMFDDDAVAPSGRAQTQGLIDTFKKQVESIENRLSVADLKLQRLAGHEVTLEDDTRVVHDDFLRWLQFCTTGLNHPVMLPSNPMYIDALIGAQEMYAGVVPKIGQKFVQVVSIDGFPFESTPGILSALAELACEYRWSSRFIFLDQHEALSALNEFRKKWRQKIRGFMDQVFNTGTGTVDQDAVSMVDDTESAIAETNSGLVCQGYYTSVVVLMDEDRGRLEDSARVVEKAIRLLGFGARVETINTLDAFFGSLPGHGVENVRRPLLNSLNFSDLLPTSTIWTGSSAAPCPLYPPLAPALMQCVTHGSTPFRFNLHVRDLGHTLMFGPTRAGKSVHLAMIALQMRRYEGMTIYSFDKGLSMYPTTKAVGGAHFEIGADGSKLAFCPLQFLDTREDRAWAMDWIDTILALNGVITTPFQRNQIGYQIMNMRETGARTLSAFVNGVQNNIIRDALEQYTVKGAMGFLLDAEQDGLSLSNFTCFELEQLMGLSQKYALPVLLYLFRRIERSLTGQPTAILIDEAWLVLDHPAFRDKIRDWLKAFAKKNCLVLLATQSLSDAANSGIFDVIVESTATKIFLPNGNARTDDGRAMYKRMGLNDRQIEIIANAIPKKQYYMVSEPGRRLYELALGKLALAFAGATDLDSIEAIKKLVAAHSDDWVDHWLASRKISLSDYEVVA